MITIKDLAKVLDLSASTVSIVLRGEGDARKISKETQQKVLQTARKLGYTPNVQAKVLRGSGRNRLVVTLFWASDIRPYILTRFLLGLQDSVIRHAFDMELQVSPYRAGHLPESMTEQTMLRTNGAIICNASDSDLAFLEESEFPVPVVLYNRSSSRYSTVSMDDTLIGRLPAEVFARHGRKKAAVICSKATFRGMDIRTGSFVGECRQNGGNEPVFITVPDTAEGGYAGGMQVASLQGGDRPDCLLCTSDIISIGVLKAFHEKQIELPGEIELISIGNGPAEFTEYAYPSVSIIELPMEEMADICLQRLHRSITRMDQTPDAVTIPVRFIARQSCPE